MKRRIGQLVLIASLVVFLFSVAFSIRGLVFAYDRFSCSRSDVDGTNQFQTITAVESGEGCVIIGYHRKKIRLSEEESKIESKNDGTKFDWYSTSPLRASGLPLRDYTPAIFGFGYFGISSDSQFNVAGIAEVDRQIRFPQWCPMLISFLVLAREYRQRRAARKRARMGLCAKCGYDLRATPGRCPECGAVPSGGAGSIG